MGKRRRRSRTSERLEIGGMPLWAIIGTVVVALGIGVFVLANLPRPVEASPQQTPRTEFTFGTPRPEPVVLSIVSDSYTAGSAENTGPEWPELAQLPAVLDVHATAGSGYVDHPSE